jgi:CDP-diacylglycerol--glycerol-3-phosphate 3-phosphatidyltransferase
MTSGEVDAYVAARLSGTVWETSRLAHATYGGCMALGRSLGTSGISPNALTYASLVLAGFAGISAAGGRLTLAACILLLSGLCDALDGMVARATGRATRFGALLDSTVDRFSDALPLLGLVGLLAPAGAWAALPAAAMLGAVSVSYVRARAESLGAKLPPLFMRRAERLLMLVLTLMVGGFEVVGGRMSLPTMLLLGGLGIMTTLSCVATVAAMRASKTLLDDDKPDPSTRGEAELAYPGADADGDVPVTRRAVPIAHYFSRTSSRDRPEPTATS